MEVDNNQAQQVNQYVKQLETQLMEVQGDKAQLAQGQMSMFGSMGDDNLIRWQLDLKEDLDRIYHLLRGDTIEEDAEGNMVYTPAKDDKLKPFNNFGVQIIMNIMSFYLNRNTILSNYSEDTINWKILDFGNELADLIFNKYEEMGMDTPDKMKLYPMIVRELVDTVHSAYLRAYHGGERESLRTARTVTQSEPLGNAFNNQGGMSQQGKRRWYNPVSWARGK